MMIVPETMTDIIGTIMVIIAIGFNIIQARKENTITTKTS